MAFTIMVRDSFRARGRMPVPGWEQIIKSGGLLHRNPALRRVETGEIGESGYRPGSI
jgi:hypothetical protein